MEFEWDETKNATNKAKHQVSFDLVWTFDWHSAVIELDDRADYGEERFLARGFAENGSGYSIVFTFRGPAVRVISVRAFNRKEVLRYGKKTG